MSMPPPTRILSRRWFAQRILLVRTWFATHYPQVHQGLRWRVQGLRAWTRHNEPYVRAWLLRTARQTRALTIRTARTVGRETRHGISVFNTWSDGRFGRENRLMVYGVMAVAAVLLGVALTMVSFVAGEFRPRYIKLNLPGLRHTATSIYYRNPGRVFVRQTESLPYSGWCELDCADWDTVVAQFDRTLGGAGWERLADDGRLCAEMLSGGQYLSYGQEQQMANQLSGGFVAYRRIDGEPGWYQARVCVALTRSPAINPQLPAEFQVTVLTISPSPWFIWSRAGEFELERALF